MPDILWPLSSAPGRRPLEGQGRLINAMAEKLGEGGQSPFARRPAPGMRLLTDTLADGEVRGFLFVNNVLVVVRGTSLLKVEEAAGVYTVTLLDSMDGAGPVYFARNNKSPTPDIVAVSSEGAFIIDLTTGASSYPDPDLDQPNSVTFQDGYFIFSIADGRLVVSGINDTTISALDFTTAQAKPGGLYRVVSFGQQLYAFGPASIEVYTNTAEAEGFPFSRVTVIPRGLLAPGALAGFEDRWAAALIWVADDRAVYRLDAGYVPQRISEPDLDRALAAVSDTSEIHALVFTHPGHPSWAIIGPDFGWVYDLSSPAWHERHTYMKETWDARCSVFAWGQWLVGHAIDGNLYVIDDNWRREGTLPLVEIIISAQGAVFPNRIAVLRADFNIVVGQGIANGEQPIETNPVCRISYSNDGGTTFNRPYVLNLGRQGKYRTRIFINMCGMTGPVGRVWKIEVSDPVYVTLLSGSVELDQRPR